LAGMALPCQPRKYNMDYFAAALTIISLWFLARKNIIGWFFNIGSSILWLYIATTVKMNGLILVNFVILINSFYGIYKWAYKEKISED
jgi:nicotinamide riboside transporter PnuC